MSKITLSLEYQPALALVEALQDAAEGSAQAALIHDKAGDKDAAMAAVRKHRLCKAMLEQVESKGKRIWIGW